MADTITQILDVAEEQIRLKGFNGFSYRDVSKELGIKTSSIHYHFATKQDLAEALLKRYIDKFAAITGDIDAACSTSLEKIESIIGIYVKGVKCQAFCLCGMMLSDIHIMSDEVKLLLSEFTVGLESYIAGVVKAGVNEGEFASSLVPEVTAIQLLATLEGAMLIARSRGEEYFDAVVKPSVAQLLA